MSKKMYYQKKATVQITVYVVKQRRAKPVATKLERRASFRRQPPHDSGSGYDRKAQLLLYSQQLRAAATCLDKASGNHKPQPLQQKAKQILRITSIHNPQPVSKAKQPPPRLQITTSRNPLPKPPDPELHLQPSSSLKPQQQARDKPWKVVEVEQKIAAPQGKLPQPPASCFGDWKKVFFPFFCATTGEQAKRKKRKKKKIMVSLSRKMSAIMMSSRMEKERIGVIARFLSAIGRRR